MGTCSLPMSVMEATLMQLSLSIISTHLTFNRTLSMKFFVSLARFTRKLIGMEGSLNYQ